MNKLSILLLVTQFSFANPEWNLKPEFTQRLSHALEVSMLYQKNVLTKGVANFVTVGGDSSCDFRVGNNKIQNAIDSGASEIRIASNDTYEENILINNPLVSLNLRGGFSSCTAALNNIQSDQQQDWTEITRVTGQTNSVFRISNLPVDNITTFENIKITIGDGQASTSGGGIQVDNTNSDLILQNMLLTNGFNIANGGALSVISSNTTVILNNTTISNNQSNVNGGGIYCNDFSGMNRFASIIINTNSKLTFNHANISGGGAYLNQNCLLSSFAGSVNPFASLKTNQNNQEVNGIILDGKGITLNEAGGSGGGVYLSSGAGLLIHGTELCNIAGQCFGDMQNPANVMENTANSNGTVPNSLAGGGIYATGLNTDVTISSAWFNANVANQSSGGAIALFDDANLTINRNGSSCWNQDNCNLFSANRASFTAGVIYNDNGNADISHAFFEGNNANLGVAMYTVNNAQTNVDASIFHHNGGQQGFLSNYLFVANTSADYQLKYITIADNDTNIGIFQIEDDPGTLLLINSSIIDDVNSGPVLAFGLGGSGFVGAFCVMAHEISSLTGSSNTIDDPEFVERLNRNYHLSNTSPAIDYCNILTTPTNKDMDFQSQGWDNPDLSNNFGPYDIGADEAFSKSYFTIGTDAACDFNSNTQTIQDVIDTGVGEVRIARNGSYVDPILIDRISVKLRGGYLDCGAADADNQTTRSTIDSPDFSSEPAIKIQGVNLGNTILIESLTLSGSEESDNSAISAINAVADVFLDNVALVGHNQGNITFGGGINITDGAIKLVLNDTIISNNTAGKGGGIYCSGSGSTVVVKGNSGIVNNASLMEGGGVYVTNSCEFTIYSGSSISYLQSFRGISHNQAAAQGGGIYADFGAKVTLYGHEFCDINGCIGDNTNPVNLSDNTSDSDASGNERGGGIYATGPGTMVNIYAGLINDNLGPNGGGIYINNLASLNVERLSADCWDTTKCNYFLNNRSTETGGAIQSDQGQLNISSTYFEENKGTSGSALYLFGSNSFARIEGSVFNHNNDSGPNDDFVIRASSSATLEVSHSTFADNFIQNTATFGITSNSTFKLYSSIVNDPDGLVLDTNPGATTIDCVMAHEATSFSGTNIFLQDPGFIDRSNRDYHLGLDSLAIDVCDNSQSAIQFKDIDFQTRGIDVISIVDVNGLFDIGADEAQDINIFKDGFE